MHKVDLFRPSKDKQENYVKLWKFCKKNFCINLFARSGVYIWFVLGFTPAFLPTQLHIHPNNKFFFPIHGSNEEKFLLLLRHSYPLG